MPEDGRGESGPDPARLDRPLGVEETSLFLDSRDRFIPGAFAAYLRTRFDFATLSDTEEIWAYDLDRGVYVKAEARIKGWLQEVMGESASAHGANETLGHIQRATYIPRDAFNPDDLLCLQNGVLELNPLEIRPHGPEPRFTAQLPVTYDPEATCPRFLQFLEEVLPGEENRMYREIVQMLFGYCLVPGNWLQVAVMLVGRGNNGKSLLLRVLEALLGPDAVSGLILQVLATSRFATAHLWGKRANIAADIPSAPIRYTGIFKALTGGDLITAERKFQHAFDFVNPAKLIFSANKLPVVDERTEAFWRRWILIPFDVDFTGREDRELLARLCAELSGILNWALEGLRMLRERGDFPQEVAVGALMEEWRRRSDSLYWFVSEHVKPDPEGWESKGDFYEAYSNFCELNSVAKKKLEVIGQELSHHRPEIRTTRKRLGEDRAQVWGWSGIKIEPPVSLDSPDSARREDEAGETGETGETGDPTLDSYRNTTGDALIEEEIHEVLRFVKTNAGRTGVPLQAILHEFGELNPFTAKEILTGLMDRKKIIEIRQDVFKALGFRTAKEGEN